MGGRFRGIEELLRSRRAGELKKLAEMDPAGARREFIRILARAREKGRDLPDPEECREFLEDLGKGRAVHRELVERVLDGRREPVGVNISRALKERLDEYASSRGVSRSAAVEELLRRALEEDEGKKKGGRG